MRTIVVAELQGLLGGSRHSQGKRSCWTPPRRTVFVSIAIIMTAIAIAVIGLLALTRLSAVSAGPAPKQLEGFTLEEVLSGQYYAESFNGTWISGNHQDHQFLKKKITQ